MYFGVNPADPMNLTNTYTLPTAEIWGFGGVCSDYWSPPPADRARAAAYFQSVLHF